MSDEPDYPLSTSEHHRWNTICVGIMTIATVILVGMFGLFGLSERDSGSERGGPSSSETVGLGGEGDVLCGADEISAVGRDDGPPTLAETIDQLVTMWAVVAVVMYALCLMAACGTILMRFGTTMA